MKICLELLCLLVKLLLDPIKYIIYILKLFIMIFFLNKISHLKLLFLELLIEIIFYICELLLNYLKFLFNKIFILFKRTNLTIHFLNIRVELIANLFYRFFKFLIIFRFITLIFFLYLLKREREL